MGIGASRSERIDADDAGTARSSQRRRLDGHLQALPVDPRIRLVEVQVRRGQAVLSGQHAFDKARNAGSAFEVSHVGLDRSDQATLARRARPPEDGADGQAFNGIADRGPRAVRLDVRDRRRIDPGLRVNRLQQVDLGDDVGHGEPFGHVAILVHRRGTHASVDRVAIGERPAERLEEHHAGAFAPDVSVGRGIKRFAVLVRVQEPGFGQHDR